MGTNQGGRLLRHFLWGAMLLVPVLAGWVIPSSISADERVIEERPQSIAQSDISFADEVRIAGCDEFLNCGLAGTCAGGTNAGNPCGDNNDCPGGGVCGGLPACFYQALNDAVNNGQCHTLADPFERRICEAGIKIDGSVRDGIAAGAAAFVDTTPSFGSVIPPGPFGDDDDPFLLNSSNGFNFAGAVLLYVPDDATKFCSITSSTICTTDGDCPGGETCDNVDRSFIYAGWDVGDMIEENGVTDGFPPRQFDTDHNSDASDLAPCTPGDPNCPGTDLFGEQYGLLIQTCTSDAVFDPAQQDAILAQREPEAISTPDGNDARLRIELDECSPLEVIEFGISGLVVRGFPTTDGFTPISTNECVDLDVDRCGARRCIPNPATNVGGGQRPGQPGYSNNDCTLTGVCPANEICAPDNDVELIIHSVETNGGFGPNAVALPDSNEARENRLALAQMLASFRGGTPEDGPGEDTANSAFRVSIPDIEVTKLVRCADTGETTFTEGPIDALIGSSVEYQITITNWGNEDLTVTVQDVLEEIGAQDGFGMCAVTCDSIQASLTSPSRGLANENITPLNAGGFNLNPDFFVPSCESAGSFVGAIDDGTSALLGNLLGATVERVDGACLVTEGDSIVITFEAVVGASDVEQFCSEFVEGDCRNSVSVSATLVGEIDVVAEDIAGSVDTSRESVNGADDNSTTVDIVCRGIDFIKEVGYPSDEGSFVTGVTKLGVQSVPTGGNVQIEYRYTVTNNGEVDELATISDTQLCSDIAATNAAFPGAITLVACPICPGGTVGPTSVAANGGTLASSCVLQFNDVGGPDPNAGLRDFLTRDDADGPCDGEDSLTGTEIEDCYRNCATATTTTEEFGDICRPPVDQFTIPSFTTICNRTCVLDVVKQVRCLPACTTTGLGAEEGWVSDPSELEVLPGACLQYRIITTNAGDVVDGVPICALEYDDLMSGSANFQSGPTNVQMAGKSCTNVVFANEFNWDGVPVECLLNSDLLPGESVTVSFQAIVGANPPTDTSTNAVTVTGAAECPVGGVPNFSCPDDSSVTVEIQECDLDVEKDVTCLDPTDPGTVFEADDLAEALPGAEVGFRFQLSNTGDVDLTSVTLTDVLTCASWYIPGSVACDIGGTDVTSCICTNPVGNCDQVTDINGTKTFGACGLPNGIPAGGVLTCTLRVDVPEDFMTLGVSPDCTNTITVQGTSDVCQAPGSNPCPEATSSASIDVKVPGIECDKQVCADLNNDDQCDVEFPFTDDLIVPNIENGDYPLTITWKYTLENTGEVPYDSSQVCDPNLMFDRDLNGLTGTCSLDNAGCADLGALAPGAMAMVTCSIEFPSEAAWLEFAAKDGPPDFCYRNDANGFADLDTTGLCTNGAETVVETEFCSAEVCIPPGCELEVTKEVRCLENCTTTGLGPDEGWVGTEGTCSNDPDQCCATNTDCPPGGVCSGASGLEVVPGACLQYRIRVTNITTEGVALCALELVDEMINKDSFISGPSSVSISGGSCSNVSLPGAFNWDGTPVLCQLNPDLAPGDALTILFTGQLRNDAVADPTNTVTVRGVSSESDTCDELQPQFTCEDCSIVPVDIQQCDLTVEKDVACDGGAFNPEIVEALPGSTATYRIKVTNTGEVDLTEIVINDVLSCGTWFVPGSVSAMIGATNVTNCICTSPLGNCDQFGDINGVKNLDACLAGGIPPAGGMLTIEFDVTIPQNFVTMGTPVDCTNTVTVEGRTDVCHRSSFNPCGMDDDDARINVLVPRIECDKCVCVDTEANGVCDTACLPNPILENVVVVGPFRVEYRWVSRNIGETDLKEVAIEDAAFCADAAEFIVPGLCPLCEGGGAIGDLSLAAPTANRSCVLHFDEIEDFSRFAEKDDGDERCYNNTSETSGTPDVPPSVCPSDIEVTDSCNARICIDREECCPEPPSREQCGPHTKAKFEIWNEFETKFSGTERCMGQWDEQLLSAYTTPGVPNYFWRNVLRTDKGKARIDGVTSPAVCGVDSINVPLVGVSQKLVLFDGDYQGEIDRTGMSLVGIGTEAGRFNWDIGGGGGGGGDPPDELNDPREDSGETAGVKNGGTRDFDSRERREDLPESVTTAGAGNQDARATISAKGSLVIFPKVEIKWNAAGEVIQDTFLDLTNDYPNSVRVQMYFVNADCCIWLDNAITLTGDQPIYWSALTGDPRFLSPFTELGRGVSMCGDTDDPSCGQGSGICPVYDPTNPGGRVLRGYIVAWAVDPITGNEISWNHLKGDAVVVNYAEGSAWEYNTWNFRALNTLTGQPLLAPFGQLDLDGMEYDYAPDELVLDFYASGATFFTGPNSATTVDTDLTLLGAIKDFRLNVANPAP